MEYHKHKDYFNKAYKTGTDIWTNMQVSFRGAKFLEKLSHGSNILDIGSGRGAFATKLAEAGYLVTGIDFEDEIVAKANEEAKTYGLSNNLRFVVANAFQLPFADGSFDGVCALGFLDNIYREDWPKYSAEVTRVLKSGGVYLDVSFSIKTQNFLSISPLGSTDGEFDIDGIHYHFFEKEEMAKIFENKLTLIDQEVKLVEKPTPTALLESLFQK